MDGATAACEHKDVQEDGGDIVRVMVGIVKYEYDSVVSSGALYSMRVFAHWCRI